MTKHIVYSIRMSQLSSMIATQSSVMFYPKKQEKQIIEA